MRILAGREVELARVGTLVFGNKRALIPAADDSHSDAVIQTLSVELVNVQRVELNGC